MQKKKSAEQLIPMPQAKLTQRDYTALAEFRYQLRCFLEFSEDEAKRAGLTPRHHQAILAIKGYGRGKPISVGDLADRLQIRHNSAVELAGRLQDGGLVERIPDEADQRKVLLQLTALAEDHLSTLSSAHLDELSRIKPMLEAVLWRYP